MLDEKTLEFFDNLTLDSMPITGKLYEAIANFIKVERISDEKDFENGKFSFTLQIREYEDSLIKIECTNLNDGDNKVVKVYNTIDGELVNVMEDNENYRKYYGLVSCKTKNWVRYITRQEILEGIGEEFKLKLQPAVMCLVNLYISESLNFHNDPFFIYNEIKLDDFSNDNGILGLVTRLTGDTDEMCTSRLMFDIAYGTIIDAWEDYNPDTCVTNVNVANYFIETSLRMIDFRNAAVIEKFNSSLSDIKRQINKIDGVSFLCTLCMINKDIEYFKQITKVYLSVYRNHNHIVITMLSLIKSLTGILMNIDDYKDYIDSVLYDDFTGYENTGVKTYGRCSQYVEYIRSTEINNSEFKLVGQSLGDNIAYSTLSSKDLIKFDKLRDDNVELVYKNVNKNGRVINLYGVYLNGEILRISDLIHRLELYFIREINSDKGINRGGRIHELYEPMRISRG